MPLFARTSALVRTETAEKRDAGGNKQLRLRDIKGVLSGRLLARFSLFVPHAVVLSVLKLAAATSLVVAHHINHRLALVVAPFVTVNLGLAFSVSHRHPVLAIAHNVERTFMESQSLRRTSPESSIP
ncbi:hypothetical protein AURDEDRAFT_178492 [Auricularia subglabra TFB-10046 SS5]|uniref:Uncharacterized protein n=1 Tax=Auricularia subglabra (strain TFB-10046 / SS5) TaxID=717982 RepID=J0WL19_AURST|nr:hypothetical protein AURDEDRAFT_178492 [Auricularia subglabra TFB-10046 SS5]